MAQLANESVFEPNRAYDAKRICGPLKYFLDSVQRARDILSFRVVCDETNNTDQDIANHIVHADVYPPEGMAFFYNTDGTFAGVYPKPEPMIELNFTATKDGVNFEPMRKSASSKKRSVAQSGQRRCFGSISSNRPSRQ